MRILFVSHYALPHLGGMEMAIDAVARELLDRGHDVRHLASDAVRADDPPAGDPPPYTVVRVPAANGLERRLGVPYPGFGPSLLRAARAEVARADVVHAHGFLYEPSPVALGLARRAAHRPARVLTEHVGHVPYDSPLLNGLEAAAIATLGRLTVRLAEHVVVLNEKVDAEIARLAPRRPRSTIPNGVDAERYRPPEPGERERLRAELGWDDAPRVLFVGRLVAKKGLPVALEAARRLPEVRLAIAGPGDPPGDLPENAELLGAVTPERVAELYRAADAFVLPSRGEGFPVTAQEAMASGLPVVLADEPIYRAYVEGAGPGVRLAAPEPEAVAGALRTLLLETDGGARAAAGAQAAAHARAAFSWSAAADAHEALYRGLRA